MPRSEVRRTVFMSSLQMARRKKCSDTESPMPTSGVDPGTFSSRGGSLTTELLRFKKGEIFLGRT